MAVRAVTLYDADWGRYRVHRDDGHQVVLADLDRPHAYVIVDQDKLASCYRPREELTDAATPARTEPVQQRDLDLDLHDDRAPASARRVYAPAVTLGAIRPGASKVSVPDRLLQYWLPCATPMDGGEGGPHLWFIADNLDPHIYCDACRDARPRRPAPPEAASIPADHPRAQTWSLWSWATTAHQAPHVAVVEEPSVARVNPLPAPSPTPGRLPWADDPDGPIWTWKEVGPLARAAALEAFGERAAIHEYDGGLSREEAEHLAYARLLALAHLRYGASS